MLCELVLKIDRKPWVNKNTYHDHNILRLFDVLPIFPFTTSEMKRDF